MDKWVKANNWVGSNIFLVVFFAVTLGLFVPIPHFRYTKETVMVIFAYITFVTSLSTGFSDFIRVLKKPWVPLWILLLLHFVFPVFAWLAGNLFYPADYMTRMGLLIIASIPCAVTSILWTSMSGGNVAVTIMAVTIDTIAAPVLLPFLYMFLIGKVIEIDYMGMMLQLVCMVTIPSIAGMLINDAANGRLDGFAKGIGGLTSKLALFFVVFFNAITVAPEIVWVPALIKMLFVVFSLVIGGFLLGYFGSHIFKTRAKELIITMMYSVGMRNISFGLVLAMTYFPASVAIPVTLAVLFQQPTAAVVSHIIKRTILSAPDSGTTPESGTHA